MAFNHYAKLKRILANEPEGWYIVKVNEPTTTLNFKNEKISYPYYYRIYDHAGQAIKYCKFQKLEKLASVLGVDEQDLPVVDADSR